MQSFPCQLLLHCQQRFTKACNCHPNSKYEICYLEFQICIQNSKYVFGIPNTYSEFQIPYSEFQIRIGYSKYPIRNSKYVFLILRTLFGISNTHLEFQICYSEFRMSKLEFCVPFEVTNFIDHMFPFVGVLS